MVLKKYRVSVLRKKNVCEFVLIRMLIGCLRLVCFGQYANSMVCEVCQSEKICYERCANLVRTQKVHSLQSQQTKFANKTDTRFSFT